MKKKVILVDRRDKVLGSEEKLKAHQLGKLHRAFSIIVFNSRGQMMLQKRAKSKYHSGGLWTNACCSHPRPGKKLLPEARIRLRQEMGFSCPLKEIFSFIYKVKLGGLYEHEFDHVLVGKFDSKPDPNPKEAEEWKWTKINWLKKDVKKHPGDYAYWFRIIFDKMVKQGCFNLKAKKWI